jgi:NTE family protein
MAMRIGVALSSGGAAGLAHIGGLEELERAGLDIRCVAGTSAGAMVGAAFAAGRLDEFRDRVLACRPRRRLGLLDPIWPRHGLCGGQRAMELVATCAAESIEDLPRRYAAVATDLDSGERVSLRAGNLGDAIRASIAIPGVLAPHGHRGRWLVDGALVDPVPVGPARELGATFVIASSVIGSQGTALRTRCFVDRAASPWRRLIDRLRGAALATTQPCRPASACAAPASATQRSDGLTTVICKASAVVQTTIAAARLRDEPPDFLIAPPAYGIGVFEVQRAAEAIEAGRAATRAALPELLDAIARAEQQTRSSFRWWNTGDAVEAVAA